MKKLIILLFLGLAFGCSVSEDDTVVVEESTEYYLVFNEECYSGLEGQFRFEVEQDIYETFSRKEVLDCSSVYSVPDVNGVINRGYHIGQEKE